MQFGGLRHVEADRVGDRLAGIDGLDQAELARVRLDQVGPRDEDPLAVARVQPRPSTVVGGPAGGRDRDVHVCRSALGHLGDRPARGGVLRDEPAPLAASRNAPSMNSRVRRSRRSRSACDSSIGGMRVSVMAASRRRPGLVAASGRHRRPHAWWRTARRPGLTLGRRSRSPVVVPHSAPIDRRNDREAPSAVIRPVRRTTRPVRPEGSGGGRARRSLGAPMGRQRRHAQSWAVGPATQHAGMLAA